MATRTLNTYAELQQFLDDFVTANPNNVDGAVHGRFWRTLGYDDFVNGDVPPGAPTVVDQQGRPIKILVKGNSAASNLILALRGQGPLFNEQNGFIGRMPLGGPYMPGDQIAVIADWIDRNCPNTHGGAGRADY